MKLKIIILALCSVICFASCKKDNKVISVTSIAFPESTINVAVGEHINLRNLLIFTPENSNTPRDVVYTLERISGEENIGYIEQEGEIRAFLYISSIGSAKITATLGNLTATCIINVVGRPITFPSSSITLFVGEQKSVVAFISPEDPQVQWSSSNASVATVDNTGKVTAKAIGEATITVAANRVTAGFTVYVNPDIYVAGYVAGIGRTRAAYWKNNGDAIVLANESWDSRAHSVFVTDNKEVLVAGYEVAQGPYKHNAKLWRNGVMQILTLGTSSGHATGVFVADGNIYVCGYESPTGYGGTSRAQLWKNGVAQNLTVGITNAQGLSVYVSGSNVYVAGFESNGSKEVAKIWKNKIPQILTTGVNDARAVSVFEAGGKVYAAGYEVVNDKKIAKLWIDDAVQNLSNGAYNTYANSVFIANGDVYVAGNEERNDGNPKAILWKNGVPTESYGHFTFLYVYNSDVYTVSRQFAQTDIFKNDELIVSLKMSAINTSIYPYSIFIK